MGIEMSNIFLKSNLQDVLDNITTAVNDRQANSPTIPNWLNNVDKKDFNSVTSTVDDNLINQLDLSETSLDNFQTGGSNSNFISKNNVNNIIDMLTSDSSENVEIHPLPILKN